MIEAMNKWIHHSSEMDKALDDFTCELVNSLERDLAQLSRDDGSSVTRGDRQLVDAGYGFLNEPDNCLSHISKDLWKGYALGFLRGQIEEAMLHDVAEDENDQAET